MGHAITLQRRVEAKSIYTVLAELIGYSSIKLPLSRGGNLPYWLTYCTADAKLKQASFEKTSPIWKAQTLRSIAMTGGSSFYFNWRLSD